MSKLDKIIFIVTFILAFVFAVNAYGMNPEALQQEPQLHTQRFIARFMAEKPPKNSEAWHAFAASYMQYYWCLPEKEKVQERIERTWRVTDDGAHMYDYCMSYYSHQGLEGPLCCSHYEKLDASSSHIIALRDDLRKKAGPPIRAYRIREGSRLRQVPIPNIFPAVKALYDLQQSYAP